MAGDRGRGSLDTGPGANTAVPANDGVQDAGVVLDLRIFQHDGLLDSGTSADGCAGTNGHVGAELGCGIHVGAGVDEDRGDDVR